VSIKENVFYAIFFDGYQVIYSKDHDITRKFTPLLEDIFLLIWLFSLKNDKGIMNKKIIEIFWHGFS